MKLSMIWTTLALLALVTSCSSSKKKADEVAYAAEEPVAEQAIDNSDSLSLGASSSGRGR